MALTHVYIIRLEGGDFDYCYSSFFNFDKK